MKKKTQQKGNADTLFIMAGPKTFSCGIDPLTDNFSISNNISFNDDKGEEKELILQRDSFLKNLITGFKIYRRRKFRNRTNIFKKQL